MLDIEGKRLPDSGHRHFSPISSLLLQASDPNALFTPEIMPSLAHSTRAQSHERRIIIPVKNFIDPSYMPCQSQAPTKSLPISVRAVRAIAMTALNKALLYSSLLYSKAARTGTKSRFFRESILSPQHCRKRKRPSSIQDPQSLFRKSMKRTPPKGTPASRGVIRTKRSSQPDSKSADHTMPF